MAEVIGRKRRRGGGGCGGDRVFRFKSFGENGYPAEFVGRFRENVTALLLGFGRLESGECDGGLRCWSFRLQVQRQPPFYVVLFVVEEPVEAATAATRHCKQCQYVGKLSNVVLYIYIYMNLFLSLMMLDKFVFGLRLHGMGETTNSICH